MVSSLQIYPQARDKSKKKLTLTVYNKSLNYAIKEDVVDEWLMPVLSVINRLFSSSGDDNGCGCSQPCKWTATMREWCQKYDESVGAQAKNKN